jgi:DNA primase
MIDKGTVDRIFDAALIMDVVQDFVTLKRRGVNYLGLCPFHNEKTPSFTVSPVKNIYKCFGCGKGGNAVNFIMEHEKIGYYEALKYLAKKYSIEVVETHHEEEDQQQKTDRESMLIASDFARKVFIDNLYQHTEGKTIGLSYFKERGFRDDTITKFELGYCLEERDDFTKKALREGYKLEYLSKTGLTIAGEGHSPFDRFSGRVMFPIHSLTGKVIAFGGRVMKNDKKTAKYLNSPESEIYHKSNVLYGLYHARKAIIQENKCYLVEGYTDVISMHQAGVENVVASSGTALTPDQIRMVKRFTNNITILYDGDPAGIKASLRGIDLVLEEAMNVRVILLPEPEDPDSFARSHSSSELTEYLHTHETDFIHFKTDLLMADAQNDPIKRAQAITEIVKSIAIVPDAISRSLFLQECSKILQVEGNVLYAEVDKQRRAFLEKNNTRKDSVLISPYIDSKIASSREIKEVEVAERDIIRYLVLFGQMPLFEHTSADDGISHVITVQEYIIKEIEQDELEFHHAIYKRVFEEFVHFFNNGETVDNKYFVYHPDTEISSAVTDIISESEKYILSSRYRKKEVYLETEDMKLKTQIPKILLKYKYERLKLMVKELNRSILNAQQTKEEDASILSYQQQVSTLKNLITNISKQLGTLS